MTKYRKKRREKSHEKNPRIAVRELLSLPISRYNAPVAEVRQLQCNAYIFDRLGSGSLTY